MEDPAGAIDLDAAKRRLVLAQERDDGARGLLEYAAKTLGFAHLASTQMDKGSGQLLVEACTEWMELSRSQVSNAQHEVREAERNVKELEGELVDDAGLQRAREHYIVIKKRDDTASELLELAAKAVGFAHLASTQMDAGAGTMLVDSCREWMEATRGQVSNIHEEVREAEKDLKAMGGEAEEVISPATTKARAPQNGMESNRRPFNVTVRRLSNGDFSSGSIGWETVDDTDPSRQEQRSHFITSALARNQARRGSSALRSSVASQGDVVSALTNPTTTATTLPTTVMSSWASWNASPSARDGKSSLPEGWDETKDLTSGLVYYFNVATGESSWIPPKRTETEITAEAEGLDDELLFAMGRASHPNTAPSVEGGSMASGDVSGAKLDGSERDGSARDMTIPSMSSLSRTLAYGWHEATDPASGRKYYYNPETGESSWDRPAPSEYAPSEVASMYDARSLSEFEGEALSVSGGTYVTYPISSSGSERSGLQDYYYDPKLTESPSPSTASSLQSSLTGGSRSTTRTEVRKAIDAKNDEIEEMELVIARVNASIEAMRRPSSLGLEGPPQDQWHSRDAMMDAGKSEEKKVDHEDNQEMEQLMAMVQLSTAAAGNEEETNRQLQRELERMTTEMNDSLSRADVEFKELDDMLQMKESSLTQMQKKNEQLLTDVATAKMQQSKSDEIRALETMVSHLTANAEKEMQLRQDVLAGKEDIESTLQKKLADMTSEMSVIRADSQMKMDAQATELRKLEASLQSESQEKGELSSQIEQLKSAMSRAREDAQKAIDAKNDEVKKMAQLVAVMQASIEQERKLKAEAMQSKSGLEGALQAQIDQLSHEIEVTQKNAEKAVQDKAQEMEEMNALIKKSKKIAGHEAKKNKELKSELERITKEMEDSLSKADVEIKQRDEVLQTKESSLSELQQKNEELLSDMEDAKAESRKEVLSKTEEIKALEEMVSNLTANMEKEAKLRKIAEMKNELSRAQSEAQKELESKNEEIKKLEQVMSSMKASIEEERKSRDESIQEKSGLENALQKKVDQLSDTISVAQESVKESALDKKREAEELMAKISQLERDLLEDNGDEQSAPNHQDALLSAMRDLENLRKLRDDAKIERDALRKTIKSKSSKRKLKKRDKSKSKSSKGSVSSGMSVASRNSRSSEKSSKSGSKSDRLMNLVEELSKPKRSLGKNGRLSKSDGGSMLPLSQALSQARPGPPGHLKPPPPRKSKKRRSRNHKKEQSPGPLDVSDTGYLPSQYSRSQAGFDIASRRSSDPSSTSSGSSFSYSAPSEKIRRMSDPSLLNESSDLPKRPSSAPSASSKTVISSLDMPPLPFGSADTSDCLSVGSETAVLDGTLAQPQESSLMSPERVPGSPAMSLSMLSVGTPASPYYAQSAGGNYQLVQSNEMLGDGKSYASSSKGSRSIANSQATIPKVKFSWASESLGTRSTIPTRRSFATATTLPRPERERNGSGTVSGRLWASFAWIITFLVPSKCIMRPTARSKQSWREKVALFVIMISCSVLFVGVFGFVPLLLCKEDTIFTMNDIYNQVGESWVVIHGVIYDVKDLIDKHPGGVKGISDYLGKDASKFFPRDAPSSLPQQCLDMEKVRAYNLTEHSPENYFTNPTCDSFTEYDELLGQDECHTFAAGRNVVKYMGDYERGLLSQQGYLLEEEGVRWFALYGRIYDVTSYIERMSESPGASIDDDDDVEAIFRNNPAAYLTPMLNKVMFHSLGGDGTKLYETLFGWPEYISCLEEMFYSGLWYDDTDEFCYVLNILMYCMIVFVATLMLVQFFASLVYVCPRHRTFTEDDVMSPVMIMMMCYNEGDNELRKGIKSVMNTSYPDENKVLVIVSDGLVTGSGEDMSTPEHLANILGFDIDEFEDDAFLYDCIGVEFRKNAARVYHGILQKGHKFLKYICIVKCGLPGEEEITSKPGNRGKRDSQVIVMDYYNKIHHARELSELHSAIQRAMFDLHLQADIIRFLMTIDADTRVDTMCLNHMVYTMDKKPKIIALCGETKVDNKAQSWVTMIQVFEYYCSHHLKKAFEAAFGAVTCLPGCFTMYRVIADDGTPLLPNDYVLGDYCRSDVETLHEKNLYHLGEDRMLTTLLLKYFPDRTLSFVPEAACWTIVPHTFRILLSQRRRWINSTIHNMFELLLINMKGVCCISMKIVVFLDIIATMILPASYIYSMYLFFLVFFEDMPVSIVLLVLYAIIMGVQVVVFMLRSHYEYIWWFFVYFTVGLPVFYLILPTYAFWNMDDFSWGKTRGVDDDDVAKKENGEGEDDEEEDDYDENDHKEYLRGLLEAGDTSETESDAGIPFAIL